jgi:hypothetical protein
MMGPVRFALLPEEGSELLMDFYLDHNPEVLVISE